MFDLHPADLVSLVVPRNMPWCDFLMFCILEMFYNDFSILVMDLIHSQNIIRAFGPFVHRSYFSINLRMPWTITKVDIMVVVTIISTYRTCIMSNSGKRVIRRCPITREYVVRALRVTPISDLSSHYSSLRPNRMDFNSCMNQIPPVFCF